MDEGVAETCFLPPERMSVPPLPKPGDLGSKYSIAIFCAVLTRSSCATGQASRFEASAFRTAVRSALMEDCTETPKGPERSIHYRSVQYSIGNVNCAVQSELDALCGALPEGPQTSSSVNPVAGLMVNRGYRFQRDVANVRIKHVDGREKSQSKSGHSFLWFGRVPIPLTCGYLGNGIFTKVSKDDTTE